MKNIFLSCLFLVVFSTFFAQSYTFDVSYNYLYSKQLDKAIQTYNFSRPFFQTKQPLFTSGIGCAVGYHFKNEKRGITLAYSYFGSEAKNENYTNRFLLHVLDLNYLISLVNPEKNKRLFGNFQAGISSRGMFRNVNGEAFFAEEKRTKSLGIGVNLGAKIGFHLLQKNKHQLSPFVYLGYSPFLYAPKNESVLLETQGSITKTWSMTMELKTGIRYQLNKK